MPDAWALERDRDLCAPLPCVTRVDFFGGGGATALAGREARAGSGDAWAAVAPRALILGLRRCCGVTTARERPGSGACRNNAARTIRTAPCTGSYIFGANGVVVQMRAYIQTSSVCRGFALGKTISRWARRGRRAGRSRMRRKREEITKSVDLPKTLTCRLHPPPGTPYPAHRAPTFTDSLALFWPCLVIGL